ncbi:MAG: hypothetical protein KDB04_04815 [Acidimicrobiales bacterium]|nr:hypothetical protein [Acidimicrobiales bacterium]HRW37271.1 hypothetical protein [Aquihabitans sp.]
MANKRDTSKQKRARENRAQRDALKARTEAAATAPEQRRTRASAGPVEAPKSKAGRAAERSARTRPVRPGDVPVDVESLEGNFLTKRNQVPGGRQVLYSFALTVIIAVLLATQKYATPEELDRNEKATPTHSIFEAYGARAWVFLLVPIVVVAVAVAYSLHPKRRTVWIGSAVALAIVALLTTMTLHLLVIAFLIYGISRASKIEGPAPGSRAARLAAERADAADDPVDDDA